jgi:hypothetical protein
VVRHMACIEVALQGEAIQREALHQAAQLNPETFEPIINGLLHGEKDLETLTKLFELVEAYMETNATQIFKPLLTYLSTEGEVRGISEIFHHIANRLQMEENRLLLFDTCNWLVEIGILQTVDNPIKLTPKSQVTVDEPAYFYQGD